VGGRCVFGAAIVAGEGAPIVADSTDAVDGVVGEEVEQVIVGPGVPSRGAAASTG